MAQQSAFSTLEVMEPGNGTADPNHYSEIWTNGRSIPTSKDPDMLYVSQSNHYYRTTMIDSLAYSTFWKGGESTSDGLIRRSSMGVVQGLYLRVVVSNTSGNDTRLVPAPMWFQQIDLLPKGAATPLQTWYGETLFFLHSLFPSDSLDDVSKVQAFNKKWSEDGGNILRNGETRVFYIPLLKSFVDSAPQGLNFQALTDDMVIRIRTRPYITASGDYQLTCTAFDLIADEVYYEGAALERSDRYWLGSNIAHSADVLDPVRISFTTPALVASQKTNYPLSLLSGRAVAFMLVCVRPQGFNHTDMALTKFVDLGPNAMVSLIDSSGVNQLSSSGIPIDFLSYISMSGWFPGDMANGMNWFVLSATNKPAQALLGHKDGGYFWVDNSNYQLQITPDAAGVAQVQSIAFGSVLTAGTVMINYRGRSTQPLAYNATAAVVKAAIENLITAREDRLTVTISGALNSAATVTVTMSGPGIYQRFEELVVLPLGANVTSAAVTTTTSPVRGLPTGTFQIDCYAMCYRTVRFYKGQWEAIYMT